VLWIRIRSESGFLSITLISFRGAPQSNADEQEEEEFPVRSLLKMQVDVTANEDFRYFNNCYHIEPQLCTVRSAICRVTKGTRPCVRVRLLNPRNESVTLPRDAPVAHIRIHVEEAAATVVPPRAATVAPLPAVSAISAASAPPASTVMKPASHISRTLAAAAKQLERTHKRCLRHWEKIITEDVFAKSRQVEARFPYYSLKGAQRPRVPFGIKDGAELLIRVGHNQDAKPVKVSCMFLILSGSRDIRGVGSFCTIGFPFGQLIKISHSS
jgi:hypothetical protein